MPNVLIVDDEERLLRVLRLGLKGSAYQVVTAGNGEDALKVLFEQPIDLVITDLRMPVMGGVDLLYEMERYQMAIPVIIMTAHAETESVVKSFKHGACDYIAKPFSVEELLVVIQNVLARRGVQPSMGPVVVELKEAVEAREKEVIVQALRACQDNKAEAAKRLNIAERTLWYKIKKHGL